MAPMPDKPVHSDDHPDCRALWPWLPACNRYRLNVNLIAVATEYVKDVPAKDREDWLDVLRGWERPRQMEPMQ